MKIVLFANTEWYLYNFRRSLAVSLRDGGHDVILLSPPGPYGAKLLALGFRWQAVPMARRSLNPFRESRLVLWLLRFFRREKVDLVHSFTLKSAVYGALAAKMAGVPSSVNAVAGMGYVFSSDDTQARLLRPAVRGLLRLTLGGRNARLILQNPDDVKLFERHRLLDPDLIRLIPSSGVDCERFTPVVPGEDIGEPSWNDRLRELEHRHKDGAEGPRSMRVLLPARMLWDKGVAEFVGAARLLRVQERRLLFLLAGVPDPGNPAAVPVDTLRRWEADGLVHWLGHVDDMPALFRAVDVVALPSYREGLPRGLIEAGACGLPLITTDAPGCREVVEDGHNGLLIPVRNSIALAEAIAKLDDDLNQRQTMGRAARVKIMQEFDEEIVIRATVAVYKELSPTSNFERKMAQ